MQQSVQAHVHNKCVVYEKSGWKMNILEFRDIMASEEYPTIL